MIYGVIAAEYILIGVLFTVWEYRNCPNAVKNIGNFLAILYGVTLWPYLLSVVMKGWIHGFMDRHKKL